LGKVSIIFRGSVTLILIRLALEDRRKVH